jgi:HSP20 family protein
MTLHELEPAEKKEVGGHEPTLAGHAYVPDVDIFEDAEAIRLWADMPGVSSGDVCVELEDNVLSIEGKVTMSAYAGLSPEYTEYNVGHFVRRFTVPRSGSIDHEGISAKVVDGVLEVKLPKAEKAKPRRVAIATS